MNYNIRLLFIVLCALFATGCASGPLGKYDADKVSESKWKIAKKSLVVGGVVQYTADLKTKGKKFLVNMTHKSRDAMTGMTSTYRYTVRSNGDYVWVTHYDDPKDEKGSTYRWKVDQEFLRPQLFWKSNYMAGNPEDKGTEKVDGKDYKVFESVMGNAMGGSTKYTYLVDESNGSYRRLSRQFVGDSHTDTYDCVEYKGSTTASDADFVFTGEAEDMMKFDMFNEEL